MQGSNWSVSTESRMFSSQVKKIIGHNKIFADIVKHVEKKKEKRMEMRMRMGMRMRTGIVRKRKFYND